MQLENCRSFVESISKRFLFTPLQPATLPKNLVKGIFSIFYDIFLKIQELLLTQNKGEYWSTTDRGYRIYYIEYRIQHNIGVVIQTFLFSNHINNF